MAVVRLATISRAESEEGLESHKPQYRRDRNEDAF